MSVTTKFEGRSSHDWATFLVLSEILGQNAAFRHLRRSTNIAISRRQETLLLLWLLRLCFCHHHSEPLLLFGINHRVLWGRDIIKLPLLWFFILYLFLFGLTSFLCCLSCAKVTFVDVLDNIFLQILLVLRLRVIVEEWHKDGVLIQDHILQDISLIVIDSILRMQLLNKLKADFGSIWGFVLLIHFINIYF